MFLVFTGTNDKSVRIDPTVVLAIEELDSGCRIHVGTAAIAVKESAEAVASEIESAEVEEEEEEEEEEDDED